MSPHGGSPPAIDRLVIQSWSIDPGTPALSLCLDCIDASVLNNKALLALQVLIVT